ncbi:hypothetical protein AAG906_027606 [Vitis piasezkii]
MRSRMEEGKGVVKHVLLAKFKDSTPPDQIEELIKSYANLVSLIPPMKAFHCSKTCDMLCNVTGIENMHQGFTHVFESTFESVEGMAEYVSHPAHVEASNRFLPHLEKVIVLDYKPTAVHL